MKSNRCPARVGWHIIADALRVCTLLVALSASHTAVAQSDPARRAYDREDYSAAAALYAPRAEKGDAEAQYRMGMMARFGWGVDKDAEAAAQWLRKAAEKGHPLAQAELGTMYRLGRGVSIDAQEAARWLRSAAVAGVGLAQLSIGRMYRDGIGVERDLFRGHLPDGLAYRSEIVRQMSPAQVADGKRLAAQLAKKEPEAR